MIVHTCKKCHVVEIYFDNERRSQSGKCVPLEVNTDIPHRCSVTSSFPCKYCQDSIYLDQRVKSKNDKLIPLNFNTNAPHNCAKKPVRDFFKREEAKGMSKDSEPMYYQDTKEGKEWSEWAYNSFLNQESQRKNAAPRCAVCGKIIESDGATCWKCGLDLIYHGCIINKKTGKKVPLNPDGTRHGVNSCPRYFMDPILDSISYDNELATFLHNGHPNVEIESKSKSKSKSSNEEKTEQNPLAAAVISKFKQERKAADEANRAEIIELAQTEPRDKGPFDFECYIPACRFGTYNKKIYERHVVTTHPAGTLCYPSKIDLKMRGWKAQDRKWEV